MMKLSVGDLLRNSCVIHTNSLPSTSQKCGHLPFSERDVIYRRPLVVQILRMAPKKTCESSNSQRHAALLLVIFASARVICVK